MTLTLRIDNYDTLEDGSPAWITLNQQGATVGRRTSMDWVLPDPARHVSGHHFDIAFNDGGYWLTDMSTNGTFLQGQSHRLSGPHFLQTGDRLIVGHYVIVADVVPPAPPAPAPVQPAAQPQQHAQPQTQSSLQMPPGTVGTWSPAAMAGLDADPWSFDPAATTPVPSAPSQPPVQDVSQDFIPIQQPTPPAGQAATGLSQPPGMQSPSPQPQPQAPEPVVEVAPPPPPAMPEAMPMPAPEQPPQPGALAQPEPRPVRPVIPAPVADPQPTTGGDFLQAFCEGAGLDPASFTGPSGDALARELGRSVRVTTEEIMRMLQDRANVKQFTRGGDRTTRSATGNNPLKFLPDGDQALEALFLKHRDGFMTGADGLENALSDIRKHQMSVFAALQPALANVLDGLAPTDVEAHAETTGNLLGGSKRAKAWDIFVKRWDEKARVGDHGMLDVFLKAFAIAYAEANNRP